MKVVRVASFPELLAAWADSEREKFSIPQSATAAEAAIGFLHSRATLLAPILLAGVRRVYLIAIDKQDLGGVRLLHQRDEPRDLPAWTVAHAKEVSAYRPAPFRFVAVARMPALPLTLVDGLHRVASWFRDETAEPAIGYLIITERDVPIWE